MQPAEVDLEYSLLNAHQVNMGGTSSNINSFGFSRAYIWLSKCSKVWEELDLEGQVKSNFKVCKYKVRYVLTNLTTLPPTVGSWEMKVVPTDQGL